MKKLVFKICAIIVLALGLAILFNAFNPKGIHSNLLNPFLVDGLPANVQIKIISAPEAFRISQQPGIRIFDFRKTEDYLFDHIPGAVPAWKIEENSSDSDPVQNSNWLVYEQSGDIKMIRQKLAVLDIPQKINIHILYGGYLSWLASGFPVTRGDLDE